MAKIIFQMGVSVDGFMQGPGRDISWHRVDEELHQHFNDELGSAGAFVGGRVTYELMDEFWPTADEDPSAPPAIVEFAGIWRAMPKVVYSRTVDQADWDARPRTEGVTLLREVDPDAVRALAARADGDLFLGGAELASTFVRLGLVDEFRVYVHPIVIGGGTPMFAPDGQHHPLELTGTRTFGNGVVLLRYRPAEAAV